MKIFSISGIILGVIILGSQSLFAQADYIYDSNGNLTKDTNKQIERILYNHLNLPDTIIYSDGRKMIFTYTAFGVKLSEQTIAANGIVLQYRNYTGGFLYSNDTLRDIQHEDGRAVAMLPGNSATPWEYQYNMTDHLGNVRATLTSKQDVDNSRATLETANLVTEQRQFLRYDDARRINAALFDHTRAGTTDHYSQRLNGSENEKYGIARSLSVMPGDTIKLEVYAKYVDRTATDLSVALMGLLNQIASGAPGVVVDGVHYGSSTSSFPFSGLLNGSDSKANGPKAFLNWVVFDRDFVFKDGGYIQMSTEGKENGSDVAHERLSTKFVVTEPGYVYAYVSNEETTPVEVYFDDLNVTQVKGPLIRQTDYDPFGLTFNDYSREDSEPNNFLYSGKELYSDNDLNWYDNGARMYDAALGRWHVIDPKAEKFTAYSPYSYAVNNPIRFNDPDGQEPKTNDGSGTNVEIITMVDNFKDYSDEAQRNSVNSMLDQVFLLARRISEGRRALGDLHKLKLKVYIAMAPRAVIQKDKTKAGGITVVFTAPQQGVLKDFFDLETGLLKEKLPSFSVFSTVNTDDATNSGKAIAVTIIAADGYSNIYEMTYAVIHELDAHMNNYSGPGRAAMEAEHAAFGSATIIELKPFYNPVTQAWYVNLRTDTDMRPGSAADRLANELRDAYESDLRKGGTEGVNYFHY